MMASLRGSVGTGTKGDESSSGRVWVVVLHHVTDRSGLARVLKLMNLYLFNWGAGWRAAVNSGY